MALALVVCVVCLVGFLSHKVPAVAVELPPLRYDRTAALREQAAPPGALPNAAPELLRAWELLARARLRQDPARIEEAQRSFAELLRAGTGRAEERRALRAVARGRFLRAADRADDGEAAGAREPLVRIARRHGLVGARRGAAAHRAVQGAWFDLRWERNAVPTPESGHVEPIAESLRRLGPMSQRAFVSWSMQARCGELLGVDDYPLPGDPQRCAGLRREMAEEARRMEPTYPLDEALAIIDMRLALSLETLALRSEGRDELAVVQSRDSAQTALVRANNRFRLLYQQRPSRRLERYLLGASGALSGGYPVAR
ncbi:MAG: hypothetical protein HY909_30205 [Deltaproteobacteria bacterium]|nr:hypothetical protein [Deltaproteobacteria bacterium]